MHSESVVVMMMMMNWCEQDELSDMFFTHAAVEAKKSTGHPTHSHVCHAVYQNGLTAIGTLDIS